jgi:lantibiotic modifying enzyme
LDLVPGAVQVAQKAARSAGSGTRWQGTTQCHGLAGNVEFLLDMYQVTKESKYLTEARCLTDLLQTFGTERDGALLWPSESYTTFTPDYMVGYAGVALSFLRMSAPDRLPHQLSVRSFRRTPGGVSTVREILK